MATVIVPQFSNRGGMPDTIQDPSGSLGRTIDNGKTGRAAPVRAIEKALQHLAAGRKVYAGGAFRQWTMTQADTRTVELRVRREAYTKWANIIIMTYDTLAQTNLRFTVTITSATDATGFTTDITPALQDQVNIAEIALDEFQIEIGTGVNTEFGTEDITLVFTGPGSTARTLTIVYIGVAPQPMEEITV